MPVLPAALAQTAHAPLVRSMLVGRRAEVELEIARTAEGSPGQLKQGPVLQADLLQQALLREQPVDFWSSGL